LNGRHQYRMHRNTLAELASRASTTPSPGVGRQQNDATTKLVRFGARDYDPETGRWTNRDFLDVE
jgi:RHS repeat-associated protein